MKVLQFCLVYLFKCLECLQIVHTLDTSFPVDICRVSQHFYTYILLYIVKSLYGNIELNFKHCSFRKSLELRFFNYVMKLDCFKGHIGKKIVTVFSATTNHILLKFWYAASGWPPTRWDSISGLSLTYFLFSEISHFCL